MTSQTRAKKDAELKFRIVDVLNEATEYENPTIEWIQKQDMILRGLTSQKISRLLSSLAEMGMIRKGKSKSLNRMVYRLTTKMEEAGYDVDGNN